MLQTVVASQMVKHAQLGLVGRALTGPVQTPQRLKVAVLLPIAGEAPVTVDWTLGALVEPNENEARAAAAELPELILPTDGEDPQRTPPKTSSAAFGGQLNLISSNNETTH